MKIKTILTSLFMLINCFLLFPGSPFLQQLDTQLPAETDLIKRYGSLTRQVYRAADDIDSNSFIKNLTGYYDPVDKEWHKGMSLILLDTYYSSNNKENSALVLLDHLLKEGCYEKGDTMALALALSNAWIYEIGDNETRLEIKNDLLKHYRYYRQMIAWQKDFSFSYSLTDTPFLAKFFWSNRTRWVEEAKSGYTLDQYLEYVDRVESYEYLFEFARKNGFYDQNSFDRIGRTMEHFVKKYNYSYETVAADKKRFSGYLHDNLVSEGDGYRLQVQGKKRKIDNLAWINHQVKIHKQYGVFVGDCTTTSSVIAGFYKAMGIPVFINHLRQKKSGKRVGSHFFTAWYDIWLDKWVFPQHYYSKESIDLEIRLVRYIIHSKDVTSHGNLYVKSSNDFYKRFIMDGMKHSTLEEYFYLDDDIFLDSVLPGAEPDRDSDKDGITDFDESRLGTDAANADSDGNGCSDLWDLQHRSTHTFAVDGILMDKTIIDGYLNSDEGNRKAVKDIYDIKTLYHKLDGDFLYLAADYYNDTIPNAVTREKVNITAWDRENDSYTQYTVMIFEDRLGYILRAPQLRIMIDDEWETINNAGIQHAHSEVSEFKIPLDQFKQYELLLFQYSVRGLKEKGVYDYTDWSEIVHLVRDDSLLSDSDGGREIEDPQGDMNVQETNLLYDIKELVVKKVQDRYYGKVSFHNDISHNTCGNHVVRFRDKDSDKKAFIWFRGIGDRFHLYTRDGKDDWEKNNFRPWNSAYRFYKTDRFILFSFPAEIFSQLDGPEILFQAGGWNTGSVKNHCDATGWLKIE